MDDLSNELNKLKIDESKRVQPQARRWHYVYILGWSSSPAPCLRSSLSPFERRNGQSDQCAKGSR